ncbi:arabinosyltransferase domain-containing protein [Allokutzneria sp. A3M-2-11 16]|uniref:arabinosyltransferase domain-containing protein n=1 Tax=Allokutzneria sp. A3M-2-11 16 TaxID=2962043 RepID=UPI0020B8E4E6|nr:arabinosyltransferase domain-containing protein [Allokutzneria sp. A3M-2-11 16]MCP3799693.1 arabinosyltransferase domain-containing protein [Allokutzneria sp. A3M-2-11 16]
MQQRFTAWILLASALVTAAMALSLPLAPVTVDQPVVTWPKQGERVSNTVVPLLPYRPLRFTAEVPCSAISAVNSRGGEVLRTLPPARDAAQQEHGLIMRVVNGIVQVRVSGKSIIEERLPRADCSYRVHADAGGVDVWRDGMQLVRHAGVLPPQVAMLETGAAGLAESDGMRVVLDTDARFQSAPTKAKFVLLILHGLLLVGCVTLAVLRYRAKRPSDDRIRWRPVDFLVPGVLLAWSVLGPTNDDDGWYLRHALNLGDVGYVGNYYHSFNAPESPFLLAQYLLAGWTSVSTSMLWVRLFPAVLGIGVWFALRWFLHSALGERRAYRALPWLLALAFLVWWLPYNPTLRPEPVTCLGVALTLALCEYARRREWVGLMAPAVLLAAFTTLTMGAGLVAWAPVALQVPWLWRSVHGRERLALIAAVLSSGTVAFTVLFADGKLADLLEATKIHYYYWITMGWTEEWGRYATLLVPTGSGNWAKRAPVLLMIVCLVFVAVRARRRRWQVDAVMVRLAGVLGFGMVALAIIPTKWTHHFVGIAAPAIVLLALITFAGPLPARVRRTAPAVAAGLFIAFTGVVIFSGPNMWHSFGNWGQPFSLAGDIDPMRTLDPDEKDMVESLMLAIGPVKVNNVLVWAGAIGLSWYLLRRRRRWADTGSARVLLGTQALVVGLLLVLFVIAPLRQLPGWSLASGTLRNGCGIADSVRVHDGRTLTEHLAGRVTYVDWSIGIGYPCVPVPPVKDGMVTPPEFRVLAAEKFTMGGLVSVYEGIGGTHGFLGRVAEMVKVPADAPNGVESPWGGLERVKYLHEPGRYTVTMTQRVEHGLQAPPTIARLDYAGVPSGYIKQAIDPSRLPTDVDDDRYDTLGLR